MQAGSNAGCPWPDCVDWDDIEEACDPNAGATGPLYPCPPPSPDDCDASEASDCCFGEGDDGCDTAWVDNCGNP